MLVWSKLVKQNGTRDKAYLDRKSMWYCRADKKCRIWFQALQDKLRAPINILAHDLEISPEYLPGIISKFPDRIVIPPGYDARGYPISAHQEERLLTPSQKRELVLCVISELKQKLATTGVISLDDLESIEQRYAEEKENSSTGKNKRKREEEEEEEEDAEEDEAVESVPAETPGGGGGAADELIAEIFESQKRDEALLYSPPPMSSSNTPTVVFLQAWKELAPDTLVAKCNYCESTDVFISKMHITACGKLLACPECTSAVGPAAFMPTPKFNKKRCHVWLIQCGPSWTSSCLACASPMHFGDFHVAHLESKAKGGSNGVENLVASCSTCNTSCGTNHFAVFIAKMRTQQIVSMGMAMRMMPPPLMNEHDALRILN